MDIHTENKCISPKEKRWGDKFVVWDQQIQAAIYKLGKLQGYIQYKEIYSISYDTVMEENLKNIYTCITESLSCIPKTNTILQINYISIKKNFYMYMQTFIFKSILLLPCLIFFNLSVMVKMYSHPSESTGFAFKYSTNHRYKYLENTFFQKFPKIV